MPRRRQTGEFSPDPVPMPPEDPLRPPSATRALMASQELREKWWKENRPDGRRA